MLSGLKEVSQAKETLPVKMPLVLAVLICAAPLAATAQQSTQIPVLSSKSPRTDMPPPSYEGQWFTTSNGCTYSRAQAPGYPTRWYIVKNPRHIGMPNAHRGCRPEL